MASALLLSAVPASLAEDTATDGKATVVSKLTDTAVTFLILCADGCACTAYNANIFPVEQDSVLTYVSVLTADLNTKATVAVYLLNEGYTSPVDGTLLDTVTADYQFAGYHRIGLNHAYQLPAGAVISVVQRQSANTTEGLRYFLPFTNATGEEVAMYKQILSPNPPEHPTISWSVGIINQNESFVCVDDVWYDWKDLMDEAKAANPLAAMIEFDNVNIKAYFYTIEGVNANHNYGPVQACMGGEALICVDCGETLIVVK